MESSLHVPNEGMELNFEFSFDLMLALFNFVKFVLTKKSKIKDW